MYMALLKQCGSMNSFMASQITNHFDMKLSDVAHDVAPYTCNILKLACVNNYGWVPNSNLV